MYKILWFLSGEWKTFEGIAFLKYGIDILWIGRRITGSPFVIQEIAELLGGYFCDAQKSGMS